MEKNVTSFALKATYASLWILALGLFLFFSSQALVHLLVIPAGLYFFWQQRQAKQSHSLRDRNSRLLPASAWCLIGLIIVGILSLLPLGNMTVPPPPLKNISKLKYFVCAVLGIFAYQQVFSQLMNVSKVKKLIHTFLLCTSMATLSGIIALVTGWSYLRNKPACHLERACGNYGMYMSYGYGLQFVMVLLTGMILFRKEIKEYCSEYGLYAAWLVNFFGLYLSYTRGALIGFLVSLPFFFFKKKKKLFLICSIFLMAFSALAFTLSPSLQNLFLNNKRLESNQIRRSQFTTAYYAVREHPLLGVGYRHFEAMVKEIKKTYQIDYPDFAGHAHNNFIEHLASTGILGALFLIFFHVFWFKEMYQRDDLFARLVLPLIVALFISGQFQYTLGDGENLFFLMAIYSLSQISWTRKQLNDSISAPQPS